jgi:hypothetical protein
MDIRALVKRIRAGIRAGIPARVRGGGYPRRSSYGLGAWEAFDKESFDDMMDEISERAEQDAEELSDALRNRN